MMTTYNEQRNYLVKSLRNRLQGKKKTSHKTTRHYRVIFVSKKDNTHFYSGDDEREMATLLKHGYYLALAALAVLIDLLLEDGKWPHTFL